MYMYSYLCSVLVSALKTLSTGIYVILHATVQLIDLPVFSLTTRKGYYLSIPNSLL